MALVELSGDPFDGYGRKGNQALAARALREASLLTAFDGHVAIAVDDLSLPTRSPQRGVGTRLISEPALIAMT